MAGKMNWTRVRQESLIQRYGYEPLSAEDRTIPEGRQSFDLMGFRSGRTAKGHSSKPWQSKANSHSGAGTTFTAQLDAADARTREKREQAQKQRESLEKKAAAARKEKVEAARARGAQRLAAMTPEQREAVERKVAAMLDARLRGVIVEHRPLAKTKVRSKKGPLR